MMDKTTNMWTIDTFLNCKLVPSYKMEPIRKVKLNALREKLNTYQRF